MGELEGENEGELEGENEGKLAARPAHTSRKVSHSSCRIAIIIYAASTRRVKSNLSLDMPGIPVVFNSRRISMYSSHNQRSSGVQFQSLELEF